MIVPSKIRQAYPAVVKWLDTMPAYVATDTHLSRHQRGSILFQRSELVQKVYLICKGSVLISTCDMDGWEKPVVFATEGSIVGEMEIILQIKHLVYNASAHTDCVLLEVPIGAFVQWMQDDQWLCRHLLQAQSEKLLSSSQATVHHQSQDAKGRVCSLLAQHQAGFVQGTRLDLAVACGISERTVYRVIGILEKEGMLSLRNGKIHLTPQQLTQLQHYKCHLKGESL